MIVPQVGESGRMSTGPDGPAPRISTGPFFWVKKRTALATVCSGLVVGKVSTLSGRPGSSATAQTHFVPPASMPPVAHRPPPAQWEILPDRIPRWHDLDVPVSLGQG